MTEVGFGALHVGRDSRHARNTHVVQRHYRTKQVGYSFIRPRLGCVMLASALGLIRLIEKGNPLTSVIYADLPYYA